MKCIKKDSKIKRVSDGIAFNLVKTKGYSYCPKDFWKKQEKTGKYGPKLTVTAVNGVKTLVF